MIPLRMFFVFKGLWWKFLEAWICKASPICGLLKFLVAFELDSNDLWDLGRWFGWFLFECSSYSKLKFLVASRLGSNKVSGLLNLGLLQLSSGSPPALLKCLRKASIYRSLGVGEQHVAESDWWHMSQPDWSACIIAYVRWIAYDITYTCWTACVISYTRWSVIWFLHDTWQIFVGFWVVIAKPSSNTWCFVIGCILWT